MRPLNLGITCITSPDMILCSITEVKKVELNSIRSEKSLIGTQFSSNILFCILMALTRFGTQILEMHFSCSMI